MVSDTCRWHAARKYARSQQCAPSNGTVMAQAASGEGVGQRRTIVASPPRPVLPGVVVMLRMATLRHAGQSRRRAVEEVLCA